MRKNGKLILLIALSALAVIFLIYGIVTPPPSRRGVSTPAPEAAAGNSGPFKDLVPLERTAKRSEVVVSSRNPFTMEAVAFQRLGPMTLNGIVWDEKNPKAVINDRIVGVGEVIGGRKVVKIEQTRVVLNDGANQMELRLGQKK